MEKTAFEVGFEKRAWDLDKARRSTASLMKMLVRRDIGAPGGNSKSITALLPKNSPGAMGPTALAKKIPSHQKQMVADLHKDNPILREGLGKIFARGKYENAFKRIGADPKLKTPEEKELFNRTVLQHERSESAWGARVKPTDAVQKTLSGHMHPQVILQESNMMATLPKSMNAVKDALTRARENDFSKQVLEHHVKGFEYGKTRLSRHGRKRVDEILQGKLHDLARPYRVDAFNREHSLDYPLKSKRRRA